MLAQVADWLYHSIRRSCRLVVVHPSLHSSTELKWCVSCDVWVLSHGTLNVSNKWTLHIILSCPHLWYLKYIFVAICCFVRHDIPEGWSLPSVLWQRSCKLVPKKCWSCQVHRGKYSVKAAKLVKIKQEVPNSATWCFTIQILNSLGLHLNLAR